MHVCGSIFLLLISYIISGHPLVESTSIVDFFKSNKKYTTMTIASVLSQQRTGRGVCPYFLSFFEDVSNRLK